MGRTTEEPIPVEETYRDLLRAAVAAEGGQEVVAEKAGVNQATISRTLAPRARATYTTMRKLSQALPGVPAPVVAVRDADHERWCRLGAQLAAEKPTVFGMLLRAAIEAMGAPQRVVAKDEAFAKLKAVVADPMVTKSKRRRGETGT